MFAVLTNLSRFKGSHPRSRDYVRTGASGVTDTWRRCRKTSQRRRNQHETDTVRFIAVLAHNEPLHDHSADDDDDDVDIDATDGSVGLADDGSTASRFDRLQFVIIRVWIFVDVLLLVRRLALTLVAVRGIHVQPPSHDVMVTSHHDVMVTSRGCITWPPSVDQSQEPLAAAAAAGQNGGPYCVPRPPPMSDDVIAATSRDLGSPEVVRVLGDASLLYVALSVGAFCLLAAAVCACAALVDHFLAAVARGSFLLPVSTYFRSAVEFLAREARHLSAGTVTSAEARFELGFLQHVISVFNAGLTLSALTHCPNVFPFTAHFQLCLSCCLT